MLLTEQEVIKLWDSHTVPVFGKSGINPVVFATLIEAELLEKLKAQEPYVIEYPDYHQHGMGCGLEDRNIIDRYKAMAYGWDCAIDAMAECIPDRLYEHPLPPDDVMRDPRVAELEAVLRECREALVKNIVGTGGRTPAAHEAIAKIDEVLNVPDISRTA